MTDYGVTPTGFVRKTYQVIVEEMRTSVRGKWGSRVNLSPDSLLGQIVDTAAAKIAEQWEVSEAAYAAYDPDQAEDASLDAVAAITGTTRDPATFTRVKASVNVDPGTYAIGDLVASIEGSPTTLFRNTQEIVNAGSTPLTITGVDFRADSSGSIPALAGTLTVLSSATVGWNSVINLVDAYFVGSPIETNASLRAAREAELGAQGSTNVDAIRADIARIDDVLRVNVLENDTDSVDGNGLLPHSIEAIVYAPTVTDELIAQTIFDSKAGGTNTNGTTSVFVLDEQGFTHTIKFTRPTTLRAYARVELERGVGYGGDAAVAAVLAAADSEFGPGDPLLWSKLICQPYEVGGVTKVLDFGLSTDGITYDLVDIVPTIRQVVSLDSSDVDVVPA